MSSTNAAQLATAATKSAVLGRVLRPNLSEQEMIP